MKGASPESHFLNLSYIFPWLCPESHTKVHQMISVCDLERPCVNVGCEADIKLCFIAGLVSTENYTTKEFYIMACSVISNNDTL